MAYPPDAAPPGAAGGAFAGLVDTRHARPVADALVASGAFTVDMRMPRDQWFRWKSGILAPCGCNCRRLNAVPAFRRVVDDALADATRSSFPGADYVIAVAHAGIPWAKTLAERLELPLAYVRAEARAVGGPLVECSPDEGARAVIIEDVVASGSSTARAIQALLAETRNAGSRGPVHCQLELPGDASPAGPLDGSRDHQLPAGPGQRAEGRDGQRGRRQRAPAFLRRPPPSHLARPWRPVPAGLMPRPAGQRPITAGGQAVISGGGSRLAGADGRRCRRVGDLMVVDEVRKEVGGDRGADQEDGR